MNALFARLFGRRFAHISCAFSVLFLSLGGVFGLFASHSGAAMAQNLNPRVVAECTQAISRASQTMGVPQEVMLAVSLTETGKNIGGTISPWPWTVNMEGTGVWFETRAEALAYVNANFQRGARSFDVGCFQINYKWHHQHFRSISDMFDPHINAMYAAKFLTDLYQETGSWTQAAGYFHSRTPEYASRYKERFARHLANLTGGDLPVFEGHGSEGLQLAQSDMTAPRPAPQWPLAQLGKLPPTEILSSRPTGSLVRLDGGRSLLTPTTRPMF